MDASTTQTAKAAAIVLASENCTAEGFMPLLITEMARRGYAFVGYVSEGYLELRIERLT